MRYLRLGVCLLFCVALASCSSKPPVQLPKIESSIPVPTANASAALSPLPTVASLSPLATPVVRAPAAASSVAIATSEPGKGTLVGQIIDSATGQPAEGWPVYIGYLAPFKMGDKETHTVTVQPMSAPRGETDADGRFVITNIPPGTYGLVIWTPVSSVVILDPQTDTDFDVTVEAGKVTDVKQLQATLTH